MHPNHSVSNIEEIIQGCKEGQRDSQRRLYEMYARSLLAVCMRYTKNRMEAEDFLHEGFLKIFDNIGQFESKGSIEGWLRRVMVNNILESYRKIPNTALWTTLISTLRNVMMTRKKMTA